MNKLRKYCVWLIALSLFSHYIPASYAANPDCNQGKVVINEAAWAGSLDNANDEWIELYNGTCQTVDLTGWTIEDSGGSYALPASSVNTASYYVIEDKEEVISDRKAEAIIGLSLSNSGEKLILKDKNGTVIDSVNSSGGAWYAGNNTTKATMERINAYSSGDTKDNWASATASNGLHSSLNSAILGTPGAKNSVSYAEEEIAKIDLTPSSSTPPKGGNFTITAKVSSIKDLFSYGTNIAYNPTVLQFDSAEKGTFLNSNGTITTVFQANVQDKQQGLLILGEAITASEKKGISGNGILFTAKFKVIGDVDAATSIEFQSDSFTSSPTGDIITEFKGTAITVSEGEITPDPVQNLTAKEGDNRYTVKLNWQAPANGADSYQILKKDPAGNYVEIGTTTDLTFGDDKKLLPTFVYSYQVKSIKSNVAGKAAEISAKESRGLLGDVNRSDRIDGRDLDQLARHFAEEANMSAFDALVDTNYDGKINGSDLLDMAANWALTYSQ